MQGLSVTRIVSALSCSELGMQQHWPGFGSVRNPGVNYNTNSLIPKLRLKCFKSITIKLCLVTSVYVWVWLTAELSTEFLFTTKVTIYYFCKTLRLKNVPFSYGNNHLR